MLLCPRCAGATLIETNGPGSAQKNIHRVYPEDRHAALEVEHLPPKVANHYRKARRALDAGLPDSVAVELRRTLEAAADDVGVKAEHAPLASAIEKMMEEGLVAKPFGEVLNHVRVVGNAGAHASDTEVTDEEARRALRFTTQVLRNLFEIPGELRAITEETNDRDAD
jgi:hypothetical protein